MPEIISLNNEQQEQVRGLNAQHGFGYFETMN
jgi:hypothetical protein